jgi:hypothetical protein
MRYVSCKTLTPSQPSSSNKAYKQKQSGVGGGWAQRVLGTVTFARGGKEGVTFYLKSKREAASVISSSHMQER